MSDFANFNEVKARKEHKCVLCGLRIRKGAKHIHVTGHYDGEFIKNDRRHAVCNATASSNWDEMDWETCVGCCEEFREYDLKLPLLKTNT